jgi:preprotein translocase subunit Sec61beta
MARDNKVRLPSSTAGITQYWDENTTKIQISPNLVVAVCVVVIILAIIVHLMV